MLDSAAFKVRARRRSHVHMANAKVTMKITEAATAPVITPTRREIECEGFIKLSGDDIDVVSELMPVRVGRKPMGGAVPDIGDSPLEDENGSVLEGTTNGGPGAAVVSFEKLNVALSVNGSTLH